MRNSLLVEQFGADNERELSRIPKLRMSDLSDVVGERSCQRRSGTETSRGAAASDNAGMSNDKTGENPVRRKPKVSWGRYIRPGLGGS